MSDDRRFDATPRRREQFRKDGRFARSRDAAALAATAAVVGVIAGSREAFYHAIVRLFHATVGSVERGGSMADALWAGVIALASLTLPCMVAAAGAATVLGLAQAGLYVDLGHIGFKAERFDVVGRLGQLFSPKRGAQETLLSMLRVAAPAYAVYRAMIADVPDLIGLAAAPVVVSGARIASAVLHAVVAGGGALLVIALIDYLQSRFGLEKQMKMTRQELMDEMKQQDGDPRVKGRLKARARALAKRRALQNVKNAQVIVTNPTHISVALRYDATDPAPVVIAKGHDEEALRIRAEARKHGIPILENRPLARALDADVPVGECVPVAHFAAVARVLAFVYRIGARRRGPPARGARPGTPRA